MCFSQGGEIRCRQGPSRRAVSQRCHSPRGGIDKSRAGCLPQKAEENGLPTTRPRLMATRTRLTQAATGRLISRAYRLVRRRIGFNPGFDWMGAGSPTRPQEPQR